jgi:hypothetical protein
MGITKGPKDKGVKDGSGFFTPIFDPRRLSDLLTLYVEFLIHP